MTELRNKEKIFFNRNKNKNKQWKECDLNFNILDLAGNKEEFVSYIQENTINIKWLKNILKIEDHLATFLSKNSQLKEWETKKYLSLILKQNKSNFKEIIWEQTRTRWATISKVHRMAVLGENTLMVGHLSYIIFYNFIKDEKILYRLRENYGEQTNCFDGCKTVGNLFTYSEQYKKNPNIYVMKFPDMECVAKLKDSSTGEYINLTFYKDDMLITFKGLPTFMFSVWNWRKRVKLLKFIPAAIVENNLIFKAYEKLGMCVQTELTINTTIIRVWQLTCFANITSAIRKHPKNSHHFEVGDICVSPEKEIFILDIDGNLYTVPRGEKKVRLIKKWKSVAKKECEERLMVQVMWYKNGLIISGPDGIIQYHERSLIDNRTDWSNITELKKPEERITCLTVAGNAYQFLFGWCPSMGLVQLIENSFQSISNFCYQVMDIALIRPQDKYIAALIKYGTMNVFKKKSGTLVCCHKLEDNFDRIEGNPSYPYVICFNQIIGMLYIYDMSEKKKCVLLHKMYISNDPLKMVHFTVDGMFIIAWTTNKPIYVIRGVIYDTFTKLFSINYDNITSVTSFKDCNSKLYIMAMEEKSEEVDDRGNVVYLWECPDGIYVGKFHLNEHVGKLFYSNSPSTVYATSPGNSQICNQLTIIEKNNSFTHAETKRNSICVPHTGQWFSYFDYYHILTYGRDDGRVSVRNDTNTVIFLNDKLQPTTNSIKKVLLDIESKFVITCGYDGLVVCHVIRKNCDFHEDHVPIKNKDDEGFIMMEKLFQRDPYLTRIRLQKKEAEECWVDADQKQHESLEQSEEKNEKLREKENAQILREKIINKFNYIKCEVTKIVKINKKEKLFDEQWIKKNLLDLLTDSQVWDNFKVEVQNEMDLISRSIDEEYQNMIDEINIWKQLFIDPYDISNKVRAIQNIHVHISTYAFKKTHCNLETTRRKSIYKMWALRKVNCLYAQEIPWFHTILNVPDQKLPKITILAKSPGDMIAEVFSDNAIIRDDSVDIISGQEIAIKTPSSIEGKVTPILNNSSEVEDDALASKGMLEYTETDVLSALSNSLKQMKPIKAERLTSRQKRILQNSTAIKEDNTKLEIIEKYLFLKDSLNDDEYSVLMYLRAKKVWIKRFVVNPFIEEFPPVRPDVPINTIFIELQRQQTDVSTKMLRQISSSGLAIADLNKSQYIAADVIDTASFDNELYDQSMEEVQWCPQFEFNALIDSQKANDWFMHTIHETMIYVNYNVNNIRTMKEKIFDNLQQKNNEIQSLIKDLREACHVKNLTAESDNPKWLSDEHPCYPCYVNEEEIIYENIVDDNKFNDNNVEKKSLQPLKSSRQRALEEMMDGTLEIQLADVLRRGIKAPSFMLNKSPENYTSEEKEEIEEYHKKLEDLEIQRTNYAEVTNKKLNEVKKNIKENKWKFDSYLYNTISEKVDAEICINIQSCQSHLINSKRMKIHQIVKHLTTMGQVYNEIRSNFNLLKKIIDREKEHINDLLKVREKYYDDIDKKWENLKQLIQYNRLGIFYYNKIKELYSADAPLDLLKGVPLRAIYDGYDFYYRKKNKKQYDLLPQVLNYFQQLKIINDPNYYSTLNKESFNLFINFKVDKQKLELKIHAITEEIQIGLESFNIHFSALHQYLHQMAVLEQQIEMFNSTLYSVTEEFKIPVCIPRNIFKESLYEVAISLFTSTNDRPFLCIETEQIKALFNKSAVNHKAIPLLRRRLKLKKYASSLKPLLMCCKLELDMLNIMLDCVKRIEVTKDIALKYVTDSADVRKGHIFLLADANTEMSSRKIHTKKTPEKKEMLVKVHSLKERNEISVETSGVTKGKSSWINRLWEQYTDCTKQISEDEGSIDEEILDEEEAEEEELVEDEISVETGVQIIAKQEAKGDNKMIDKQLFTSQKMKRSLSHCQTRKKTSRDRLELDPVDKHLVNIAETMQKKIGSDVKVKNAVETQTMNLTYFLEKELKNYKITAKNNEISIKQNQKDNVFIRQRLHAEKNSLKCKLNKLQIENAILEKELELLKIKSFPTFSTRTKI